MDLSIDTGEAWGVNSHIVKAREALQLGVDALLKARGKSRNKMSGDLDRSTGWISQILSGKRSTFLEKLDQLAEYLDVPPAALFGCTDAEPDSADLDATGQGSGSEPLMKYWDEPDVLTLVGTFMKLPTPAREALMAEVHRIALEMRKNRQASRPDAI